MEFDFRCKIKGNYAIIDMQQWYKQDIVQRFFLYHALNTGLQLEGLPKKNLILDKATRKIKKIKDYRSLEPVLTLIWMVDDNLGFDKLSNWSWNQIFAKLQQYSLIEYHPQSNSFSSLG